MSSGQGGGPAGATVSLGRTFRPRTVAIVGAKDSSVTSFGVVEALERVGFDGDIFMVNRSGAPAHGRRAARSCVEIGHEVDAAVVLAPAQAVPEIIEDAGAARIRTLVLLSSGWAEAGADGRARQAAVASRAMELGITLIGPNSLGFMNFAARTGVWVANVPPTLTQGPVAVVSQSGGIGNALVDLAAEVGIGVSHVITTGNEAMMSTTDALGYLLEEDAVRAVALFCEAVSDPPRFVAAADRAAALGKAIVVLKAGSSRLGARNAMTHTASLVGDDLVIDAAFRQLGVVRVRSLEELLVTASLLARTGPVSAPGIAVVSISGGAVDIVADDADRLGLPLPEYDEAATAALRAVLPSFAAVQNPMDITGAALQDQFADVLSIVDRQAAVGVMAVVCNVPAQPSCKDPALAGLLGTIGRAVRSVSKPVVVVAQTVAHSTAHSREIAAGAGVPAVLPGLSLGTAALRHLVWWSGRPSPPERRMRPTARGSAWPQLAGRWGPVSEWDARTVLAEAGVPLVPAVLCPSAESAAFAARQFGGTVAVKVVSPAITHKARVGGVQLGVIGDDPVREAYRAVVAAASRARPDAVIEGVLVSPMRTVGVEMLAGVTRDDTWGLVLVVGAGGAHVEEVGDVARRLLPVTHNDVDEMLAELRWRGGQPALASCDRASFVDAVLCVADAANRLGDRLESLEVNPFHLGTDGPEAIDALVVLRPGEEP